MCRDKLKVKTVQCGYADCPNTSGITVRKPRNYHMNKKRRNHSAAESINIWMNFYNQERTLQSLDSLTSDEVHFQKAVTELAA